MKRRRKRIKYFETGRYHINHITERYHYDFFKNNERVWMKVLHLSSYEICNVFTDDDTVLSAYLKLNGETSDFKVVMDNDDKKLNKKQSKTVIASIQQNDNFNCHGFTFLDSLFWFELDNEKVSIILKDDNYQECKRSDLKENGIGLYYNKHDNLVHSGRMIDGVLTSKFGINTLIIKGEDLMFKKYKSIIKEKSKYYNKG